MTDTKLFKKKQAYDRVVDVWLEFLTAYEFTVLIHLTRALTSYGFEDYALSHASLQDGIESKKNPGEWFIAPLKNAMSLATMRRALDSLEAKGVISIQRADKKVSRYAIIEGSMPLAIPKRLQEAKARAAEEDTGSAIDNDNLRSHRAETKLTQSAHCAHTERVNRREVGESQEEINLHDASRHEVAPSFEISDSAQSKIAAVKNRSGEKLKPDANIEKVWRTAMAEEFPRATFMGWTVPQKGMMNGLAKKWTHTTVPFSEFVDWSVRNWRRVLKSPSLSWCTNAAPTPDLMFFIKATFNGKFLQEFTDERLRAKDFDFSKNAEYQRLTYNQAMSHDEAMQAIGESKGVIKTVRRLAKDRLTEVASIEQAERDRIARQNALKVKQRAEHAAREAEEARKKAEEPKPAGSGSFDDIDLKSGW